MDESLLYVVVATSKETNIRKAITTPVSQKYANQRHKEFCKNRQLKKRYKYFKVAKYPYTEKNLNKPYGNNKQRNRTA